MFDYPIPKKGNYDECCEHCDNFHRIDSGYGWCTLNPPSIFTTWKRFLWFFWKPYTVSDYPVVPWNMKGCSHHTERKENAS